MVLVPVIICGGSGSRLWPVSRELHPKPFIKLDHHSLIQKTFLRAANLHNVENIVTVINKATNFLTLDDYADLKKSTAIKSQQHFILEPVGRNTAPAIAVSALYVAQKFGVDAIMLVLPADHLIQKTQDFQEAVTTAIQLAQSGRVVTFGICPTHAETGFGYIESNGNDVVRFIEKPNQTDAQSYVDAGYLWNAGMFCFSAGTLIAELDRHAPSVMQAVRKCITHTDDSASSQELILPELEFAAVEDISIDYALMEKSDIVSVVACDIGWSDIGSWNAMSELTPADEHGNQVTADSEAIMIDSSNCYIKSDTNRIIATLGLQDLVIIDTPDALLIADRKNVQDVKKVVTHLKSIKHEAYQLHRTVNRPWGTYTTLEEGDGFKMKRIVVKPGGSLSLQMHHHRSEHWIVVSGTAKIVNGDNEQLIHPNQSTYIPAGQTHRLTNPGVIDCVMIEVQVGSYLGEDDIVRFKDIYGRK